MSSTSTDETPKLESDVLVVIEDESHCAAIACAIGRSLPLYSRKKSSKSSKVNVRFATPDGTLLSPDSSVQHAVDAVRLAGRLVDTPTSEMNVKQFVQEARDVQTRLKALGHDDVTMEVISGNDLQEQGYGGLYGVGKSAASDPPALVVLTKTFFLQQVVKQLMARSWISLAKALSTT